MNLITLVLLAWGMLQEPPCQVFTGLCDGNSGTGGLRWGGSQKPVPIDVPAIAKTPARYARDVDICMNLIPENSSYDRVKARTDYCLDVVSRYTCETETDILEHDQRDYQFTFTAKTRWWCHKPQTEKP